MSEPIREPRYPYRGRIHLLVGFAPWRLRLTLQGVEVGPSGVSALLTLSQEKSNASELLSEGDAYDLQLEPEQAEGGAGATSFLPARLQRRIRTGAGWEVDFRFEAPDTELLGLVHEQALRCGRASESV